MYRSSIRGSSLLDETTWDFVDEVADFGVGEGEERRGGEGRGEL